MAKKTSKKTAEKTGDIGLVQQGDVLFYLQGAEQEMPAGLKRVPNTNGLATFALGEATGHHHSAVIEPTTDGEDNIELYEDDKGQLWCKVLEKPATVTHQEHGPVFLEPGLYRRGIVKEYDHLAEEARQVRD